MRKTSPSGARASTCCESHVTGRVIHCVVDCARLDRHRPLSSQPSSSLCRPCEASCCSCRQRRSRPVVGIACTGLGTSARPTGAGQCWGSWGGASGGQQIGMGLDRVVLMRQENPAVQQMCCAGLRVFNLCHFTFQPQFQTRNGGLQPARIY